VRLSHFAPQLALCRSDGEPMQVHTRERTAAIVCLEHLHRPLSCRTLLPRTLLPRLHACGGVLACGGFPLWTLFMRAGPAHQREQSLRVACATCTLRGDSACAHCARRCGEWRLQRLLVRPQRGAVCGDRAAEPPIAELAPADGGASREVAPCGAAPPQPHACRWVCAALEAPVATGGLAPQAHPLPAQRSLARDAGQRRVAQLPTAAF
jgi:hypothetical protein